MYGSTRWGGQTDNGALRWDRNIPTRGVDARPVAQRAAEKMQNAVDGLEAHAASLRVSEAAALRDAYAPLYYDLHRANRIANAPSDEIDTILQDHIRTRRLAHVIATRRPPVLNPAIADGLRDQATEADFAREYMLFKHSLLLMRPDDDWAPFLPIAHLFRFGEWTTDAAKRLDSAIRLRLRGLARSPVMAAVAYSSLTPTALVRGLAIRPTGDLVYAETGKRVEDENNAVHFLVISIAMRHMAAQQRDFDEGFRERTAGQRDKSNHLSVASHLAGEHLAISPHDGKVGHFPLEFAHGIARGETVWPHTPSSASVAHAKAALA